MMDKSIEYWRRYFGEANMSICDIIENAVIVAALDYPQDFMVRRDRITELMFSCKCKLRKYHASGLESRDTEFNCCGDGNASNFSYQEAEALDRQIQEESHFINEVFRIKKLLDNYQKESDITLLGSLRTLQLMDLSVDILKVTEIGKSVNGLTKQGSKQIRDLALTLKEGWITLLDPWMNATPPIAENTSSELMKTSPIDLEEGLPCPPLDEGALFGHSIELSDIFDGMDDDGNPMNHWDAHNNGGSGRKLPLKEWSVPEQKQQQQLPKDLCATRENKVQQTMKEETITKNKGVVVKPIKPSREVTGTRPQKISTGQKVSNIMEAQLRRDEMSDQKKPLSPQDDVSDKHREKQSANSLIRKKSVPPQQEKVRSSDEAALMQLKIEASKRKLQERYQEAEKAKKKRTIQVVELQDIPKQGAGRNRLVKPGHSNHNRHWANGRR